MSQLFNTTTVLCDVLDRKDELTLFLSAVRVNEKNAKCWNNVGHALETVERYDLALPFFARAASVQWDDVGAIINVARTLRKLNDTERAEQWFNHAIYQMPRATKGLLYRLFECFWFIY